MSNRLVSNIALFSGLGLLTYAIVSYSKRQKKLLENFDYEIVGGKLINLSFKEVEIELTFRFANNSDLEVVIKDFYIDIYINGTNVGFLSITEPFIIKAQGDNKVPIRATITPDINLSNILGVYAVGGKNYMDYSIQTLGYANIKSSFIQTKVPIDYTATLGYFIK